MSTAADFIGGGLDLEMTCLTSLQRKRANRKEDPYNPDRTVEDWADPDVLAFSGYVSSQTSTEQTDAVRAQLITTVQIIVPDTAIDIRKGDRITDGTHSWSVTGIPTSDINPFTGWQPTLVVDVEEVDG
jgi:hypothetical protein